MPHNDKNKQYFLNTTNLDFVFFKKSVKIE